MNDARFNKLLLLVNGLVPLALLAWDWSAGDLGANPVEFFLRTTGLLTLVFLFLSLAVTPLRTIFGWNRLVRLRRMLGLFAFFYGTVHLVTYSVFDKSLVPRDILADVWQRPFIAVGMLAFFLLIPLAVTSTNGWVRRLGGKNWARLHRAAYAVAVLGLVHFFWIQKSDYTYPVLFALVLAFLLGYRIYAAVRKRADRLAPQTGQG